MSIILFQLFLNDILFHYYLLFYHINHIIITIKLIMIMKEQAKVPLRIFLCFTVLATCAIITALVISYVKSYVGLLINRSTTFMCNNYLTFKL